MNASSPRAKKRQLSQFSISKTEAKELGYDEAILLDMHGFVSEGR